MNGTGSASPSGGTERILVVDDESDIGRITRTALERLGYHVTVMNRSVDALAAFCADPNAFDLIITDHAMPMLTGEQLAKDVLRRKPGMPIIITTGLGDTMTEERAMALGLRGYILKPYLMKDLAVMVRRALNEAEADQTPTA
ncbi:MAG: response regulator [Candidatus Hydrogenedentes bacterium]|nr:response regulator [Candidatus Hydrogenedentota bacterium]